MGLSNILIYYMGCVCLFCIFTSCGSEGDAFTEPTGSELIRPTCDIYIPGIEVDEMGAGGNPITRGEGVKGNSSAVNVRIFRADESEASVWPSNCSGLVSSTAGFTSSAGGGTVTFTAGGEMYYQPNGKNTKLLGMYPNTTVTVNTSNQATYALDGCTDLMATAWSATANRKSTTAQQPALTFNHLLSQLIISVVAENTAAVTQWGNISASGITVDGMKNSCVVTLPIPTAATAPTITSSSGSVSFTVNDVDGKAIAAKAITTTETVYGYCLMAPETYNSATPLKLTIKTAQAASGVSVSLPPTGVSTTYTFEAGKAYTIRLKMTAQGIEPTASIAAWTQTDVNPGATGNIGSWGTGGSIANGEANL